MMKGIKGFSSWLLAALECTPLLRSVDSLATVFAEGLCVVLVVAGCSHQQINVGSEGRLSTMTISSTAQRSLLNRANFQQEHKSDDARRLADWVVDSGDNRGMPFALIDKIDAKVFVFDSDGRLRGAAPVLLGLAKGDESIPDIGDKKLSEIRPEERTTPAGRFVASMGNNANNKDVLWVDYKEAISLHRVVTSNPGERRLERLASPNPTDRRISYGCINVPADFFDGVVKPSFTGTSCMVYILPETHHLNETFGSYYEVEQSLEAAHN